MKGLPRGLGSGGASWLCGGPDMSDGLSDVSDYGLPRRWVTSLLFGLTAIFALALFLSEKDRGTIALCLLGSAALAVFWPLVSKVDNMKLGPSGLELSKRVEEAKATADDASNKAYRAVETITRFVFNSMPQPTFNNLQKIASGRFGRFQMSDGFRQELRNLRDSGYIRTNGIFVSDIPASGDDLSEYVYCTELGKEFIDQRLAVEKAKQILP